MSGKAAVSQLRGGASSAAVSRASLSGRASRCRGAGGSPGATEARGGFRDVRLPVRTHPGPDAGLARPPASGGCPSLHGVVADHGGSPDRGVLHVPVRSHAWPLAFCLIGRDGAETERPLPEGKPRSVVIRSRQCRATDMGRSRPSHDRAGGSRPRPARLSAPRATPSRRAAPPVSASPSPASPLGGRGRPPWRPPARHR